MTNTFLHFSFFLFYSLTLIANTKEAIYETNVSTNVRNTVNALTGHFFFHQVDAISSGVEPILIGRSYVSNDGFAWEGGWSIIPHDRFEVTSGSDYNKEKVFYENSIANIQEPSGQIVRYTRVPSLSKHKHEVFTPDLTMSYDPRFHREVSGRTDPKNNLLTIEYRRKHDSTAILALGNGGKRIYKKKSKQEWFFLKEEVKPNGNILIYHHDDQDRLKSITSYNPSRTKIYSHVTFTYHSNDPGKNRDFAITINNGRQIHYHFEKPWSFAWLKGHFYLETVTGNGVIPWKYGYDWGYKAKRDLKTPRAALINEVQSNGESILKLSYYIPGVNLTGFTKSVKIDEKNTYPCGLVLSLSETINANEQRGYSINYSAKDFLSGGITTIKDAFGNETEYVFGDFKKIQWIHFYDKDRKLIRTERFKWNCNDLEFAAVQDPNWTGNDLELHAVIDPKGEGSFAYKYSYDTKGNIKSKTLYGNLTGKCQIKLDLENLGNGIESYTTFYDYSDDGFNLLKEKKEQNGLTTHYEYEPRTDLLKAEYVCKGEEVLLRCFYLYNEDKVLVEKIFDDGATKNLADPSFRSLRKFTEIILNTNNYPEKIEEYGVVRETGEKILIGARKFKYYDAPQHHLVEKETVIDSEGKERYFILKTYDGAEHLAYETISFNGATNTWVYNNRHFLESRQKSENAKETFTYYPSGAVHTHSLSDYTSTFTYDFLNHKKAETDPYGLLTEFTNDRFGNPVLIAIEQSVQRNECDFWGRPIKQIDPKGYETQTIFNARGQPIKIVHPTGEETFIYNLKGNLIDHVDLDQTKTVYEYGDFDRVCKKTIYSSEGKSISDETKTYGSVLLESETDLEGYKTEYQYDHAGRKTKAARVSV